MREALLRAIISRVCFGLSLLLFLTAGPAVWPEGAGFSIGGTITYENAGPLYVKLLDKAQFERDVSGKDSLSPFILKIETVSGKSGKKSVPFNFDAVPKGSYAISAFQDVNRDGKLGMGLFGPTEPWDMYRVRPSFKPVFKNVSFDLTGDMRDIRLVLK